MKKLKRFKKFEFVKVKPLVRLNQIIFKHKEYFNLKNFYVLTSDQITSLRMKYAMKFLH